MEELEALVPVLEEWSDRRNGVLFSPDAGPIRARLLYKVSVESVLEGTTSRLPPCGQPENYTKRALVPPRRIGSTCVAILSRCWCETSLLAVVTRTLEDRCTYKVMAGFYNLMMTLREAEERERELDHTLARQRRRRSGGCRREAPTQLL